MKLKTIVSIVALFAMSPAMSFPAAAADGERQGVSRDKGRSGSIRPAPRPSNKTTTRTDHRNSRGTLLEKVSPFAQWMIGANKTSNVDGILNRGVNPNTTPESFYNLKGMRNKRFLQYERQGTARGINIGWTESASAQKAVNNKHWGFFPQKADGLRANVNGLRRGPVVYGEIVAIGWWMPNKRTYREFSAADGGNVPSFLRHTTRNVGPNLEWSRFGAAYEWVILGGEPGTPVRRGEDRVILFNLKTKQPLLYGERQFGAHLGFKGYSAFNAPVISNPIEVSIGEWASLMLPEARQAMTTR